jgi:hypothetical protein
LLFTPAILDSEIRWCIPGNVDFQQHPTHFSAQLTVGHELETLRHIGPQNIPPNEERELAPEGLNVQQCLPKLIGLWAGSSTCSSSLRREDNTLCAKEVPVRELPRGGLGETLGYQ